MGESKPAVNENFREFKKFSMTSFCKGNEPLSQSARGDLKSLCVELGNLEGSFDPSRSYFA